MTHPIVREARSLLGTRFRHRGRRSTGVDCVGLGVVVFRACGIEVPDFRLYGREPHADGLVERIRAALGPEVAVAPVLRPRIRPGDVLVFRFDVNPHHVGLAADYLYGGLSVIHADGHTRRVIEQRFTDDMLRRVTHVFRKAVP